MKRFWLCAAAAGLAAAMAEGGDTFFPSRAPQAPCRAEVRMLANNMPIVRGELDGRPCTLLFDTGATHTTFDIGFVRRELPDAKLQPVMLGGETNVSQQPSLFHAGSLRVGEAVFEDFNIMALDLSALPGSIGEKIDGVLGLNLIGLTRTRVSLGGGEVVFGLGVEAREGFESPARRKLERFDLSITLLATGANGLFPLLVDSASSFTFLSRATGWPAGTNRVAFAARDINGRGGMQPAVGEKGTLHLEPHASLDIAPLVVDEPLNRIGADTLRRYDLLIEPRAVAFRLREEEAK